MARRPKPFVHQGWFCTTAGGAWRKLCPEADGLFAAYRVLGLTPPTAAKLATAPDAVRPAPLSDAGPAPTGPTLADAVTAYLAHAKTYHRSPGGKVTSEPTGIAGALGYLTGAAPGLETAQLTKEHLKNAVATMVKTCSRKTCNQHLGRIKRFVKWLADRSEIPDAVAGALLLVRPLPAFRSAARESAPVPPVAEADVNATLAKLPDPWAALVRFQWVTGVRPGEACGLLVAQVDLTPGAESLNFGLNHKTGWRGKMKSLPLGPRAVELLRPWLASAALRSRPFVFATTWTKAAAEARPCSVSAYDAAVKRAAKRAGVAPWKPNQLRHSFATRARAALGLEAAQHALGHARADVTQIYAEGNAALAKKVADLLG